MSNEGLVTEKECKLMMNNTKEEAARSERRLNEHSQNLDELANISSKLTLLVEQQSKTIEDHAKRILDLEKSKPWYETEIGKYIIKAGIWLLFIIVAAAIGLNALDTLNTVKTIK